MTAKKKKLIKGLVAVALIAIIGIGATFAYLSFQTDTKTNKFTSDKNVTGSIKEKNWTYGDDGWKTYQPGDITTKDPVITNDSTGVDVYVAMKVTCKANEGTGDQSAITFADLQKKYVDIFHGYSTLAGESNDKGDNVVNITSLNSTTTANGIDSTKWAATSQDGFYIYKTTLAPGKQTAPLFDAVRVKTGIYTLYSITSKTETETLFTVNADGTKTKVTTNTLFTSSDTKVIAEDSAGNQVDVTTTLPSFTITVTGYGVQAANTTSTYVNELGKLAGYADNAVTLN